MKHILSASVLVFSTLLPAAPAQTVPAALTGRIVKAPANPCDPTATHAVDCTGLLLRSSTVALAALEGQIVDLSGTASGIPTCPLIDVAAAQAASVRTTQLAPFGTRLGRSVIITTFAPAGALVGYLFAGGTGFVPLGQFGTLLLDPLQTFFVGPDISIGIAILNLQIPNNPALIGASVWYQTAFLQLTPQIDGRLLNAGCITILQ